MRLFADRTHLVRHAAASALLCLAAVALPGRAAECTPPVLGKTTLAEARELWAACDAQVVSVGNLAIGGGKGADGHSSVGLEQVLLVTVEGVEFEGLPVARYAFVDEVLYAVSARLRNALTKEKKPFKELSDDEIAQLQQTLAGKYGKPRALNVMFSKKPNVFVWDRGEAELTLSNTIVPGYQLNFVNKTLAKKVDAYAKAECKRHRPKGDGQPITSVCL